MELMKDLSIEILNGVSNLTSTVNPRSTREERDLIRPYIYQGDPVIIHEFGLILKEHRVLLVPAVVVELSKGNDIISSNYFSLSPLGNQHEVYEGHLHQLAKRHGQFWEAKPTQSHFIYSFGDFAPNWGTSYNKTTLAANILLLYETYLYHGWDAKSSTKK
jgi:hypothetical protein